MKRPLPLTRLGPLDPVHLQLWNVSASLAAKHVAHGQDLARRAQETLAEAEATTEQALKLIATGLGVEIPADTRTVRLVREGEAAYLELGGGKA